MTTALGSVKNSRLKVPPSRPMPGVADAAERAAGRYGVPAHEILQRAGELGYVGGQEDMIIDIAVGLAQERDLAATGAR